LHKNGLLALKRALNCPPVNIVEQLKKDKRRLI
jgi:hypothetical protein